MPDYAGKLADPAFRRQRAQRAAQARTNIDFYIRKLVEAAPPLTDEQRAQLAELLAPRRVAPRPREAA